MSNIEKKVEEINKKLDKLGGNKPKKWGIGTTLFFLFVIGIAVLAFLIGKFGISFGKGTGFGTSNSSIATKIPEKETKDNTKQLKPICEYRFECSDDKIYFHKKEISWADFRKQMVEAHKKNEIIEIIMVEDSISSGFNRELKKILEELEKQFDIKYELDKIRSK